MLVKCVTDLDMFEPQNRDPLRNAAAVRENSIMDLWKTKDDLLEES